MKGSLCYYFFLFFTDQFLWYSTSNMYVYVCNSIKTRALSLIMALGLVRPLYDRASPELHPASILKTTSFDCLQLAQKPRSLPSGFLLFLNLHSFQRLLQPLRGQNEVWASLKWQAAWNSKNILKQRLGSKLTYGYPQIAKWWGDIQYAHDGSCKWREEIWC